MTSDFALRTPAFRLPSLVAALWMVGACLGCGSDGDDCRDGVLRDGRCITPEDAGADASGDAGMQDGGEPGDGAVPRDGDATPDDAGPPPATPQLRFPWNGYATGSLHSGGELAERNALRPKLMWDPAEGAVERYEVQLSSACTVEDRDACPFDDEDLVEEEAPGDTHRWRPASELNVSGSPPVGTRYVWRVRACNDAGCSDWSEVRYLEVGRSHDDFNGDGYADLAIGDRSQNVEVDENVGQAFVFYGGATGVDPSDFVIVDNPATDGAGGQFGRSLAGTGDLDGDGFADLVVGASFQEVDGHEGLGQVFVFYGGLDGIDPDRRDVVNYPGEPPSTGLIRFGSGVAGAGDLDGDGFFDLLVGADRGQEVFVFRGGPDGPGSRGFMRLENPGEENGYGRTVASAGDLDGDGAPDVIVGAYRQNEAFVYYGASDGVDAEGFDTLEDPAEGDNRFGWSVDGGGDVDGDGFADVVVGAYRQIVDGTSRHGRAYVYYGARDGVDSAEPDTLDNPNEPSGFADFGIHVAGVRDLDGNGLSDVVVGAYNQQVGERSRAGQAVVFLGGAEGVDVADPVLVDNPTEDGILFGYAVSSGDFEGDGLSDLLVGAGGDQAFVFYGAAEELDATETLNDPVDPAGGRFGQDLASAP